MNFKILSWFRDKTNDHEDIGLEVLNTLRSNTDIKIQKEDTKSPIGYRYEFEIKDYKFVLSHHEERCMENSTIHTYTHLYIDEKKLEISKHTIKRINKECEKNILKEESDTDPIRNFRNDVGLNPNRH